MPHIPISSSPMSLSHPLFGCLRSLYRAYRSLSLARSVYVSLGQTSDRTAPHRTVVQRAAVVVALRTCVNPRLEGVALCHRVNMNVRAPATRAVCVRACHPWCPRPCVPPCIGLRHDHWEIRRCNIPCPVPPTLRRTRRGLFKLKRSMRHRRSMLAPQPSSPPPSKRDWRSNNYRVLGCGDEGEKGDRFLAVEDRGWKRQPFQGHAKGRKSYSRGLREDEANSLHLLRADSRSGERTLGVEDA